jgi:FkbM family methyltransferase
MLFKSFEKHLIQRRGVIHVGANTGEERNWYKEQGFKQVLWFEPNISIFRELQENIKGYENNVAFNIGIHDTLKNAKLHISNNAGQSSSILELGTHKQHHPSVHYIEDQEIKLMRMDNFLFLSGRDIKDFNFLNVDVQGVELNVIKSFGNMLGGLDYIYAEVNEEEVYKGCALITEIDYYVAQYKFERVDTCMTKNKWGDAFYVKKHLL